MIKIDFTQVTFIKSAIKENQFPDLKDDFGTPLPEVAVAGRSNVGKSSLLNALFRRKNLVKTSSTPGKTQLLNFFQVGQSVVFVDLPGYGFAKVPPRVRAGWAKAIEGYLNGRDNLKCLLFLFDIRRLPNEEDMAMIDWAHATDTPLLVVFTKADKISSSKRKATTDKLAALFGLNNQNYLLYSVPGKIGRLELIRAIHQVINGTA